MINKPDSAGADPFAEKPADDNEIRIRAGLQQLAAAAMTSGWMEKITGRAATAAVTPNELTSLSALIAYVAFKSGINEFRIERELSDRFNVANVKLLPSARFDDAMHYLVDRVPASR